MTRYLTCDAAGEMLEAFIDGELPMADQVALESHLRWCSVCAARIEDMQLIGVSLRFVAQTTMPPVSEQALEVIQSNLLTKIDAEREQSVRTRVRGWFSDMRLFWPAIGASTAVAVCVLAAMGVFAAATDEERPNSLAGMIAMLANPGSDQNPMTLGGRLSLPRAVDTGVMFESSIDDDAVYALSTVLTKDGRIATYELLLSERSSVRRLDTAAEADAGVPALIDAVRRSRFEPAQDAAGDRVAVNMIWLVARTTVKGSPAREAALLPRSRAVSPAVVATPEEIERPVQPTAPISLLDETAGSGTA